MKNLPGVILCATVWAYWLGVGIMVVRVHRKTQSLRLGGLVPQQPLERLLWTVWVPLVAAWLVLPYFAMLRRGAWLRTPPWAIDDPAYAALRWIAVGIAVVCLLLTARCWARMDANWSMAVSDEHRGELIVDGLFARLRHPIYTLSMVLMACTAAIVATPLMLAIALMHVVLMHVKARNEERHLLAVHGDAYAHYLRRTRRFSPRLGAS
ncbi:MAG: isoprenylcysteine carboxylmethyltransferase family protein [Casimicrobiaceae bacterium]